MMHLAYTRQGNRSDIVLDKVFLKLCGFLKENNIHLRRLVMPLHLEFPFASRLVRSDWNEGMVDWVEAVRSLGAGKVTVSLELHQFDEPLDGSIMYFGADGEELRKFDFVRLCHGWKLTRFTQ